MMSDGELNGGAHSYYNRPSQGGGSDTEGVEAKDLFANNSGSDVEEKEEEKFELEHLVQTNVNNDDDQQNNYLVERPASPTLHKQKLEKIDQNNTEYQPYSSLISKRRTTPSLRRKSTRKTGSNNANRSARKPNFAAEMIVVVVFLFASILLYGSCVKYLKKIPSAKQHSKLMGEGDNIRSLNRDSNPNDELIQLENKSNNLRGQMDLHQIEAAHNENENKIQSSPNDKREKKANNVSSKQHKLEKGIIVMQNRIDQMQNEMNAYQIKQSTIPNQINSGFVEAPSYSMSQAMFSTTPGQHQSMKENGFSLGHPYSNLRDNNDLPVHLKHTGGNDIIFVWLLPGAGSMTAVLLDVFDQCFSLIRATKVEDPESLDMVSIAKNNGNVRVINVETSTPSNIENAQQLNLIEHPNLDLIHTANFYEGCWLFTNIHRGRFVTFLRHPMERMVALYNDMNFGEEMQVSLLQFLRETNSEDNRMVRYLTNVKSGPLGQNHVDMAAEILSRKALVLLTDFDEISLIHAEKYFGFESKRSGLCMGRIMASHSGSNKDIILPSTESEEYTKLFSLNQHDLKLYEVARKIFEEQGKWLGLR